MSARTPRSPTWTATVFGLSLIAALMTGVGGYQLWAADALQFAPPAASARPDSQGTPAARAAGAPMCPGSAGTDLDGRPASLVTFGGDRLRAASGTWSSGSPLGVGSVCD